MKVKINHKKNECYINYYVYGSQSNPIIFLLHGWSRSGLTFEQLSKSLSINYFIVSLDLPGFGNSNFTLFNDKNLNDYSQLISNFINMISKKYDKESINIVGHSFGGRVSINMIAHEMLDQKMINTVFIAPSGYNQKGIADEFEMISPEMREFKNRVVRDYETELKMKQDVSKLYELNKEVNRNFIVVNGTHDEAIPVEHSYRLANEIGCSFWSFPKTTHDVYLENNRGVSSLIHDFIVDMETPEDYDNSSSMFNRTVLQYTNKISKWDLLKRRIIKQKNIFRKRVRIVVNNVLLTFLLDILKYLFKVLFWPVIFIVKLLDFIQSKMYQDEFLHIGVLFGGKSVEHEVSIQTGILIMNELSKGNNVKVYPLYLYKDTLYYSKGYMFTPQNFIDKDTLVKHSKPVILSKGTDLKINVFGRNVNKFFKNYYKRIFKLDNIIVATHGTNSEDGSIAAFMEYKDIPYTSCNISSSVIGQDKVIFKDLIREMLVDFNKDYPLVSKTNTRVELVAGVVVLESEYDNFSDDIIKDIESYCKTVNKPFTIVESVFDKHKGTPLYNVLEELDIKIDRFMNIEPSIILKPAHLGSSIGISIISNLNEFELRFTEAFSFDNKILIEKVIPEFRELNCSIKKTIFGVKASRVSEENQDGFYSFEDKYISSKKVQDIPKRKFPATLSKDVEDVIRMVSAKVYYLLGAKAVVRIDYMYDEKNKIVYLNEINNIPGSFAFYFWQQEDSSIRNYILSVVDDSLKEYRFKR